MCVCIRNNLKRRMQIWVFSTNSVHDVKLFNRLKETLSECLQKKSPLTFQTASDRWTETEEWRRTALTSRADGLLCVLHVLDPTKETRRSGWPLLDVKNAAALRDCTWQPCLGFGDVPSLPLTAELYRHSTCIGYQAANVHFASLQLLQCGLL